MASDAGELGTTLRTWRNRGTPALRRVELADRAGISADYVKRLEQGRVTTPSAQVVAALARALRLTPSECGHLYRLAGLNPPEPGEVCDELSPGRRRMLGRLGDVAVGVFAADWRIIWWSPAWAALLGDPSEAPPDRRNFARDSFPVDGWTPALWQWPVTSLTRAVREEEVVFDLRRATGRYPHSARVATLVDELRTGNSRFAELWTAGAVGVHRQDHKVVDHPVTGPIEVDCDVLTDAEHEQKIVMLTTEPGSEAEARLRRAMGASVG